MPKKTKANKEKNEVEGLDEKLLEENQALKDYIQMGQESYRWQRVLVLLERIAKALEDSLESDDDKDDEED